MPIQTLNIVRKQLEANPDLIREVLDSNPHLFEYQAILNGTHPEQLSEEKKQSRLNFLKYAIKKNASEVILHGKEKLEN